MSPTSWWTKSLGDMCPTSLRPCGPWLLDHFWFSHSFSWQTIVLKHMLFVQDNLTQKMGFAQTPPLQFLQSCACPLEEILVTRQAAGSPRWSRLYLHLPGLTSLPFPGRRLLSLQRSTTSMFCIHIGQNTGPTSWTGMCTVGEQVEQLVASALCTAHCVA